jgi:hypothetical protein
MARPEEANTTKRRKRMEKKVIKVSKKDREALCEALMNLERGQYFLTSEQTMVCRRKPCKTTTLDFTNDAGEVCVSIDKQIGSPLALLYTGIGQLRQMLGGEAICLW